MDKKRYVDTFASSYSCDIVPTRLNNVVNWVVISECFVYKREKPYHLFLVNERPVDIKLAFN